MIELYAIRHDETGLYVEDIWNGEVVWGEESDYFTWKQADRVVSHMLAGVPVTIVGVKLTRSDTYDW